MRPRTLLLALFPALALTLGGCAATDAMRAYQDSIRIPPGSVLTLNRPLELPGAGDYLYIQDGRPVAGPGRFRPHCFLETRAVPEPGTRVEPTRFTITRVTRDTFYAGLPGGWRFVRADSDGGGDGPTSWYFITRLWLEPESDTDVYRISCQVDRMDVSAPPIDETHLSVAEVREALEGAFTLELAPRQAASGSALEQGHGLHVAGVGEHVHDPGRGQAVAPR